MTLGTERSKSVACGDEKEYFRNQCIAGVYTGWPKKVSHYQVSPLNRIKNRH